MAAPRPAWGASETRSCRACPSRGPAPPPCRWPGTTHSPSRPAPANRVPEPRCLLLAEVAGLAIGTAHLSHIGAGERLLQAVAAVAAFGGAPAALLLGDLNAAIEAPELAPFAGWTGAFPEPPRDPARI